MPADSLEKLEQDIFGCKAKCMYFKEFKKFSKTRTPHSVKKKTQWLFWGKNKAASCAAPPLYIPFKYNGDLRVMFAAPRPSAGGVGFFPGGPVSIFAEELIKHGLAWRAFRFEGEAFVYYEGVFVTDIIKCRGLAKHEIGDVPKRCKDYLRRELEIVRPDKIIAVGKDARGLIWRIQNELGLGNKLKTLDDVPWVPHYAWGAYHRKSYEEKFREI